MLDPRLFRGDLDNTAAQLARRDYQLDVEAIARLEGERKKLQVHTQELQKERNQSSKSIGQAKAKGEDIAPLLAEVVKLGEGLKAAEQELNQIQSELESISLSVPNMPPELTPAGKF